MHYSDTTGRWWAESSSCGICASGCGRQYSSLIAFASSCGDGSSAPSPWIWLHKAPECPRTPEKRFASLDHAFGFSSFVLCTLVLKKTALHDCAVDCVMVELKLSWFNTVFLKALLPFKYKRFQVLGDPRESWSDVFTRTLLTGMSRSSSVRSALLNTYSISLQQSREENSGGQFLTLRCLPKSVLRLCAGAALEYWGFDHFLSL